MLWYYTTSNYSNIERESSPECLILRSLNAKMSNAKMSNAKMSNAKMSNAKMSNAKMSNEVLIRSRLTSKKALTGLN